MKTVKYDFQFETTIIVVSVDPVLLIASPFISQMMKMSIKNKPYKLQY